MDTGTAENQVLESMGEARPLWQTCCFGCLFGLAALVIGVLAVVFLFGGPGIERVKVLPTNFPKDIQVYRPESAKSITVLSGSQRGRLLGVVLAPVKLFRQFRSEKVETESGIVVSTAPLRIEWLGKEPQPESWFDRALRLAEGVDTVSISWEYLPATRQEVLDYYGRVLAQAGMKIVASSEKATRTDLLTATAEGMEVQVHLQPAADGRTVENLVLIVNYRNR